MNTPRLLSSLALALCLTGASAYASDSKDFHTLLQEHWQNVLDEQVFFRRDPDVFRMNGKLPDLSDQGRARRQAFNESVLQRLDRISSSKLSRGEQISYKLFRYERETERRSYNSADHLFPMNIYAGFHTYFAEAPGKMSFLTEADYDKYLISLADYPRYNGDFITTLTEAISRGYTHYCGSFLNYHKTISRSIVDDVTHSEFYAPVAKFPASISADKQAYYRKEVSRLIGETVIPEYRKFYNFFTKVYMPGCRQGVGVTSLDGGGEYYKYLINYYTTTDMAADDIHALGLSEVKRIRAEMQAIIDQVGFEGDFKSFLDSLRENPNNYAESPRDLLEKASFLAVRMSGELPKWFTVLPRNPFNIKPSPGGGAYYVASSGDGTTPGTYYIGAKTYDKEPLYNLEALTYHEAVPGHHFQGALAQELDLPEFRKTLSHSAYTEGWGLYSESLGKEAGFYEDPYSDFGRLTYEIWRACRLVVDTGMHAFGWSRQQAIDYLLSNTALSQHEVEREIDRYISWPAQALSYKIGELRIKALRRHAEDTLGERFDIRRFHDTIVGNGSMPLAVLEEIVEEWIAAQ